MREAHPFYDLLWENVKNRYGTHTDTASAAETDAASPTDPLGDIARRCIRQMKNQLLGTSLWNVATMERYARAKSGGMLSWQECMAEDLMQALTDQLVISFALRFCCCNLEPNTEDSCIDALFQCTSYWDIPQGANGERVDEDGCSYDDLKEKFAAAISRAARKHIEIYRGEFEELKGSDIELPIRPEELETVPYWVYTHTMSRPHGFRYSRIFESGKSIVGSSPDTDYLDLLRNYIGRQRTIKFMLAQQPQRRAKVLPQKDPYSATWLRSLDDDDEFLAVPAFAVYETGSMFKGSLPSQRYKLKNQDHGEVDLPPQVQIAFNNYILEEACHGHAVATMHECIAKHDLSPLDRFGVENKALNGLSKLLPTALLLNAPLLHSKLIRLLDSLFLYENDSLEDIKWVVPLMVKLNKVLMTLNSRFLKSVWEAYGDDAEGVYGAIEGSVVGTGLYSRCNLFRLVGEPYVPTQVDPVIRKTNNRIAKLSYELYAVSVMSDLPTLQDEVAVSDRIIGDFWSC